MCSFGYVVIIVLVNPASGLIGSLGSSFMVEKSELSPTDILGPEGRIAARLANYEHRQAQLEMADSVAAALRDREHLIVEAGTGVGKSFAYLVPAILAATSNGAGKHNRVVISTHTISLQEQIERKDIPFLNSVIPREFASVLVKGRRNYLSLRRLRTAISRADSLFDRDQDHDELKQIYDWSSQTSDGSLSDLTYKPNGVVWDEVASDHGNCMGRKCPTFKRCFYYAARQRQKHAQLLIVNHALFFTDLALRARGFGLLPDYDAVVLDEAHTIPAVAGDHLGLGVSSGQVEYQLNRLYNDRTNRGLLVHHKCKDAQMAVDRCRVLASDFFDAIQHKYEAQLPGNGRVTTSGIVENQLSEALTRLSSELMNQSAKHESDTDKQDFVAAANRLESMAVEIDHWLSQELENGVHWIETQNSRRGRSRVLLQAAPVNVGEVLRPMLFQAGPTVIMTSATLATGTAGFEYFRNQIGLAKCRDRKLGSPFDYRKQAKIVLISGMPEPTQKSDYQRMGIEVIKRHVQRTGGRAFVLFTSYDMLRRVAADMSRWLTAQGLELFSQADGMPRHLMLEKFKANPSSVLMGTDSFWQGIDVPGDALQTVIITRLPFSVPDRPLMAAKMEYIAANGGNPFYDMQLPEAIIKLRQGFGRLIRSAEDRGRVVILDPRIQTKRYGKHFLDSLPDCEIVVESVAGEEFA